ncbi:MAG: DUF309 domain-containing protein [Thiovulaceae bacterium]|nr:DUF309 domain-containing protein [Sulfurimonadaceae bacterium]
MDTISQRLDSFLACMVAEKFYEAHEILEEVWFPKRFEPDDEVKLLKGFINAAVSCELLKRGRAHAAPKAWRNYLKYRPLLFRIDPVRQNRYFALSREIEKMYLLKNTRNSHRPRL